MLAPMSGGVPGSALCTVVMVVAAAVASTSPLSVQSLLRPGEDTTIYHVPLVTSHHARHCTDSIYRENFQLSQLIGLVFNLKSMKAFN